VLLSVVGSSRHSKPTPTGAPFYIASRYRPCEAKLHFSDYGVNRELNSLVGGTFCPERLSDTYLN
jgi:hypothetical protein